MADSGDYNLKSFSYDTRGFDSADLNSKISTDVSAFLTTATATFFKHMGVVSNDQYVIVSILWNDDPAV